MKVITNNDNKALIVTNDVEIDYDAKLVFDRYPFLYAKDDHNIMVVSTNNYEKIIEKLKEKITNEYS